MKPKSLRFPHLLAAAITSVLALSSSAFADDRTKADNTTNLDLSGSWDTLPTAADIALWTGVYDTADSLSAGFTASTLVSWQGIKIGNITGTAAGTVIIGSATQATGSQITIGSSGIDLSTSNQNLTLNPVTVAIGSTNQTWNTGAARTIRLGAGNLNGTLTGSGTITLSGSGLVELNPAGSGMSGFSGKWIIGSGTTLRTLQNNGLGTNTASDAVTLSGGTLAVGGFSGSGGNGNWSWANKITLTNATSSTISAQNPDNGNRWLDLTGAITGSGNLTFSKTQTGQPTFKLKNYGTATGGVRTNVMGSGDIAINGVTLTFEPGEGMAAGLSYTYNNKLSLNNGTILSYDGFNTFAGTVALTGSNTIKVEFDNKSATFSNKISGTGKLTKTGSGKLTLSGVNDYADGTELTGGTLSIGAMSGIGTGYLAIKSGATLEYTGAGTETRSGILWFDNGAANINVTNAAANLTLWRTGGSFTQTMTKTGDGTLRFGGNGDHSGANAIVNGGVLEAISSTGNNFANVTVNNGGTFRIGVLDGTGVANGANRQIWDGGVLTVNTGGTFNLNGINETVGRLDLFGGSITGAGTLTSVSTIAARSGSSSTSLAGANGITKTTADTVTLSGANTYTGKTTVTGGTLKFAKQASLYNANTSSWTAANINVASGATLALNVDSAGTNGFTAANLNTLLGNISVANSATDGLQAGAILGLDTSTATGATFTQTDAIANATGANGGALGLTKLGAGALILDKTNTYTGTTTISGGTLQFGDGTTGNDGTITSTSVVNNANLTFNRFGTSGLSYGGVISGSGTVTKTGAGTQELSAQNTYTGGTTVTNGVLDLTGGGGNIGAIRGTATVNAGGILRLSTGDATGYDGGANSLNTINLVGGTLHVNTTSNQTLGSGVINMTGGSITGIAGSNLDFYGNGSKLNILISSNSSTISLPKMNLRQNDTVFDIANGAAANDLVISSIIGDGPQGNHNMIKTGGGTMLLSGNSTFTGNVTVNGGVIKMGGAESTKSLGALNTAVTKVVVGSGGTIDFSGVADVTYGYTIAGTGANGTGALINTGSAIGNGKKQASNIKLSANASIGGTGNWALLANAHGATSLDLNAFTLTKTGSNTVYLTNTTITAGTIQVSQGKLGTVNSESVGTSTALILDNTAGVGLELGENLTIGSLAGGGATGGNASIATGKLLTVGGLNTDTSYAGVLSGTDGRFTKTGSGILTLSGDNTYTGATSVNAGTLLVGVGGAGSITSNVSVASSAILGGSGTITGNVILTGESGPSLKDGGTLAAGNSPGTLTVTGTTTFNTGSIFSWELDTDEATSGRGTTYDGLNTSSVIGSGAIFQIVLGDSEGFSDNFWSASHDWNDIFKNAAGDANLADDWRNIFSSFDYTNGTTTLAPTGGEFSWTNGGNTLTWTAVPEPTSALAGLLIAAGLLRRRRCA